MDDHRSRLALVAVGLSQIGVTLDDWSLSVALPPMSHDMHVSTTDLQWAISGDVLAFAAALGAAVLPFARQREPSVTRPQVAAT